MKRLKILSLTSLAVGALLVFAATASASIATSKGSVYTGPIEATATNSEETPLALFTPNWTESVECESSTIKTAIESHGFGITAQGAISQLSFKNCTGDWTLTVKSLGSMEIHKTAFLPELAFPTAPTLTITTSDHFGTSCNYVVAEGEIMGILAQSEFTNGTAYLSALARFELESGDMGCSEEISWNGKYIVNTPDNLDFDLT